MALHLPEPLSKYFAAASAHDSDALVACFAADATVHDEGKVMQGLDAIRAWYEETARKYQTTFEPTNLKRAGDRTIVTAIVAGTFAGSPIELDFNFKIANTRIETLEIG